MKPSLAIALAQCNKQDCPREGVVANMIEEWRMKAYQLTRRMSTVEEFRQLQWILWDHCVAIEFSQKTRSLMVKPVNVDCEKFENNLENFFMEKIMKLFDEFHSKDHRLKYDLNRAHEAKLEAVKTV